MNSTAVVIGAGVGGISTAARLARHGYQVTVVEKLDRPGGRCGRLEIDGYRMDTGPTLLLMPEVYRRAFTDLGACIEDHLDLHRVDPTYHLHFGDGSMLALTSDFKQMQSQLEAFEQGSYGQFLRYFEEGFRHYRQAMPHLVERNFRSLAEFASFKNLLLFLRLKTLRSHYANLGSYFADPRLKAAFSFQDMYMGLSPYEAPALYSLLPYAELAQGIWFPMGGMYSVVEELTRIAEGLGVEFLYGSPARSITVNAQRATGVCLASGRQFEADLVVANADLSYVYRSLLPDDGTARRLDRKRHGCSVVIFYWGLDRRFPQLETHNLFFAEDYRRSLDPVFEQLGLADDPSFYVHAPSRVDPSMAPEGSDSLMVAVPVGHIDEANPQDYDAILNRARKRVMARLTQLGLTDLEAHIKMEQRVTPRDLQNQLNLVKGSAHGLSHNLTQMGYLRPHNQHPRYRNLYFVGASTHPGTGMPTVLISARLAAERILEEIGSPAGSSVLSRAASS
jgi:phytoene desaturase